MRCEKGIEEQRACLLRLQRVSGTRRRRRSRSVSYEVASGDCRFVWLKSMGGMFVISEVWECVADQVWVGDKEGWESGASFGCVK